jgi:tetratricopeptide (TPR) repeat protein
MEDTRIIYSKKNECETKRRERERAVKEVVAKGAYSIIFVVLALIALRPLMVDQMLSRADAYATFGLHDEAKRQCSKALLLDDNNGQAWHKLARIHKAQGNIDMALGAYQMATASDHTNTPAHFEYAMMHVEEGRHKQAIPLLDRVRQLKSIARAPDGSSYHKASLDMLLLCYEKVGDQAKVEFTREEMRVFYPHHTPSDTDA